MKTPKHKIMLHQYPFAEKKANVVVVESYKKPDKLGHVGYAYGKNFCVHVYPENLKPTNDPKQLEEGEKLKKHYNLKD